MSDKDRERISHGERRGLLADAIAVVQAQQKIAAAEGDGHAEAVLSYEETRLDNAQQVESLSRERAEDIGGAVAGTVAGAANAATLGAMTRAQEAIIRGGRAVGGMVHDRMKDEKTDADRLAEQVVNRAATELASDGA